MPPEDKSKVDELSDTLYSRTRYESPLDDRSSVKQAPLPEVKEEWQSPKLDEILTHERISEPNNPFMKKFFIFAMLFFGATILVAGFVFFGGVNFISSKNVDINVVGPTIAPAGEVLELGVTVENGNNADMEMAVLTVHYPQGTRDPQDSSKQLTFNREEIGAIGAGDEAARNIRLVILGSAGEVKEVKFSVEYKVKGSNATFYKDKIYEVSIGSSPLTLSVESPLSVVAGESFTTAVTVSLNAPDTLKNVMLRAEYPYGYSPVSSSPQALAENNIWSLGDIPPGGSKRIEITGVLSGVDQDERTFRFYAGVGEGGSLNANFRTVILSTQHTVAIERPFIGLSISFNGENVPVYVAPGGQQISSVVRFQNNLPDKLANPKLEVRLSGNALNKTSVVVQNNGIYSQASGRLSWTLINPRNLAELSPGESGNVSFSFSSLQDSVSDIGKEIALQFIFTGVPLGSSRSITITENRTVRVASQVTLSSRATHSIGPFNNDGPIPPQVGRQTTYSVVWSVGNTQSDLANTKMTARLGTGVKWVGAKSSPEEKLSYDPSTNTVTWELGTLSTGTGFSAPAREVAFQVGLTPVVSQIGTAPALVSAIALSGFDELASRTVVVSSPALTTKLTSDPAFIQGDDIVVK